MDNKKKSKLQIPPWGWLIISFLVAMLLWFFLSVNEKTARSFPFLPAIIEALGTVISRGILAEDFISSMISVLSGFALGFVTAVPVAFLMAWYLPVRNILEPWIQFIRNIPPLAYVPLVVIAVGVGRKPQIIVIWLATFLIMTVTIYQGVRNVDETLLKAARVLGAKDKDLFIKVVFPATTPFILTAVRLGVSVALTTLIAAESTGASAGMGMRIRSFSNSFEVAPMLLYIILIGIIGITSEKIIKVLERKLTGWQEKREI
ncbi:ABC transporter permease [Dysosmobacter sp.]|uniref:ABC transporter permease n=1 Tax=Dysosmobacter sp. TaxID=2591382 RepID=UPI002A998986|nr:ABC transporter permease [Dysosmobacter sp.]MDY5612536.1 ABC transporter permease [Dysosmobacter sp.]